MKRVSLPRRSFWLAQDLCSSRDDESKYVSVLLQLGKITRNVALIEKVLDDRSVRGNEENNNPVHRLDFESDVQDQVKSQGRVICVTPKT